MARGGLPTTKNWHKGTTDTTPPSITSGNPSGSYIEGVPIGGTLTADEIVTWSKSGTDAARVTLNTTSGLWALEATVYATKASYSFAFTAADKAGNTSSVSVSITITQKAVIQVAPVLSGAIDSATGQTTASVSVSTTGSDGTLYWFVSTSATPPTAAALKAGTGAAAYGSVSVSGAGPKSASVTGLTAATSYYTYFLHRAGSTLESSILAADGFTTSAVTVTAGAYNGITASRNLTGYAIKNLKTDYGAHGDGVTDDYQAIQNWLNAAGTTVGLYAPAGTYVCSQHPVLSTKSNRTIYGDGPNLTIFKMLSSAMLNGDTSFVIYKGTNIKLYDFKTYAPNTTARAQGSQIVNSRGIYGEQSNGVSVTNVIVDSVPGASMLFTHCTNVEITHCTNQNGKADGTHFTGSGTANCTAQYNKAVNVGDDAFAAIGVTPDVLTNIQFLDNESYDCYWGSGCAMEGVNGGKIYRNKHYRTGIGGIRIDSQTSYKTSACDNIDVRDNYLEGCVTRDDPANPLYNGKTNHGSIMVFASYGYVHTSTFANNEIVNPVGQYGVRCFGSGSTLDVSATFTNNTLTNTTGGMTTPFTVGSYASLTKTGNTFNGAPC